jgi:hypothetical protein
MNWLANQIGMSKAQMSKIVGGSRSIAEPDARVLSALVSCDFRVLFEYPTGYGNKSEISDREAA